MAGQLEGKVALVTGGASGIGEATVRLFHAEGASVVLADVQQDRGKGVVADLADRSAFVPTDVAREEDIAAAVDTAVAEFGALDVMFNNAGVLGVLGPIDHTHTLDLDMTIAVNLRGVILGMKHAARVMKPRRSGVILSTSSPAGVVGGVGPHVYSAVKAGIIGLSNSVAAELRQFGVRVNSIVPGAVVSAMTAEVVADGADDLSGAKEALGRTAYMDRPLQPADVTAGALFLAGDQARYITGIVLPVDAGMTGAGGSSPFATGRFAEPDGLSAAGRRTRPADDTP